jgi:hypothetical protein
MRFVEGVTSFPNLLEEILNEMIQLVIPNNNSPNQDKQIKIVEKVLIS